MKNPFLLLLLFLMCLAAVVPSINAKTPEKNDHIQSQVYSTEAVELRNLQLKLWSDQAIWTRSFIVSAIAGLDDQEKVLARLLQNQVEIGNSIRTYYGNDAGEKLAGLLKDHILITNKLVVAAKSGTEGDFKKFNEVFSQNTDEIVAFLSALNPNWQGSNIQELFIAEQKMITENIAARLKNDWSEDIVTFDKGVDHFLKIGDTMTEGIIKQFPKEF